MNASMPYPDHNRPLRVLMVSDVYFPRINGVSTSIETFRRALADFGVEVRLVVPRYGDEADTPHITRVAGRAIPGDPEDRLVGWRALHDAARAQAADCDLVHVQTPFVAHYAGLAAARHHGLPTLLTYHTLFEEYLHHYAPFVPGGMLRALARRISRAQCNGVDGVVVPSSAMRDRLAAYGATQPLHVLPTGIPVEAFRGGDRARFRAAHAIAPDAPVALYVGRVAHEKNIGMLLEVAARVARERPDFVLAIAGEGPAGTSLRARVASLGLTTNVRFIGYLDRATELPDCYASADVFAFASRTETQGLVLLEAMAAGLPVVALAAMGTIDILAPARGSIAPRDDVAAFAQELLRVINDRALRERLSGEAFAHSAAWHEQVQAGRLAEHYRALVATRA